MKIAVKEGIDCYDASYLYAVLKNGLTLVTDDTRLRNVGDKYVETISSIEV